MISTMNSGLNAVKNFSLKKILSVLLILNYCNLSFADYVGIPVCRSGRGCDWQSDSFDIHWDGGRGACDVLSSAAKACNWLVGPCYGESVSRTPRAEVTLCHEGQAVLKYGSSRATGPSDSQWGRRNQRLPPTPTERPRPMPIDQILNGPT
jgi:hypothetical protein